MEGSNYTPPTDDKDYNNDFDILKNRKVLFFKNRPYLKMITATNIDEIYNKSYNSFLFDNSDEVEIDGVIFFDKFERLMLLFNDKNGQNSIKSKTVTTNNIKDGFPITEIDFIKTELEKSRFLHCKSFKEEKQLELWIKKLNEKLVSLSTTIQEPEIIDTSKDLPEIEQPFSSQRIKDLFDYLNEWYKDGTNAKYTYIFDLIKENEQPLLNVALYFEYCIKITGKRMNARPQSTATSDKKKDEIKRLYNDFLNQLKQ